MRILKVVANPKRRAIMRLLRERNQYSWIQLQNATKSKAGTFAFHMRELTKAGLIEKLPVEFTRQKSYCLTDRGLNALGLTEQLESLK